MDNDRTLKALEEQSMKAMVLHGIGDLRVETISKPELKENEALLAVKASGICGSDISRIYRTGAYSYPLIPGHEFSGVVTEVGAGVDKGLIGKHAGVFPLIPCRTCTFCLKRQYEMCRNYSYLGSRRNGGFAEYVAVPAENLLLLPGKVSFTEAAMLEPMAVAVHAMRRVLSASADVAAVCGLGTIGLMLLMFLCEAAKKSIQGGIRILAIGNKNSQKQIVQRMGLPENDYCDSRICEPDKWIAERTNGRGVEVFFDCVGKNETLLQAINNTMPGGRICLVGNPYTDMKIDRMVYGKLLRNQLTVTGTWNSAFTNSVEDDWHYVLERLFEGAIEPGILITHRFSLEELWRGLHIMRDKTEDYVKIMGIMEE